MNPPTPLAVGVSKSMVHLVPPNSPDGQAALYSQLPDLPNSACLRLPDPQVLRILRFRASGTTR